MRLWFDTEFIEDGKTIELLSIGIVREDGRGYYAEFKEADRSRASDWVKENVLPYLSEPNDSWAERDHLIREIVEFAGESPEWWAYYADYDWVALCQLFGTMMDLPSGWPMYCRDVQQLAEDRGVDLSNVPQPRTEHHALNDALWCRDAWMFANGS